MSLSLSSLDFPIITPLNFLFFLDFLVVSILRAVLYSSYCKLLGNTQLKEQLLEKKPCLPNSDPEINRKKVKTESNFLLYLLLGDFYHPETRWIPVTKYFTSFEIYFVRG